MGWGVKSRGRRIGQWLALVVLGTTVLLSCVGLLGCASGTTSASRATPWTGTSAYLEPSLYPVAVGLDWGFIDKTGNLAMPLEFEGATDFQEGLAGVKVNGAWGFIDSRGEVVIKPQFQQVDPFSEGLAAVQEGDRWGYVDYSGKYVIQPQFAGAGDFGEGLAPALKNEKDDWGYIDRSGQFVIEPKFMYGAWKFGDDLAAVEDEDTMGYVDPSGKYVANNFHVAGNFSGGFAIASVLTGTEGEKYGVINTKGKFVAKPEFGNGYEFSEGLGAVEKGDLWGYVDETGALVIQPQFKWAFGFHNGLAQVKVGPGDPGEMAYIDKTGKVIWRESDATGGSLNSSSSTS